MKKAYPKVSKIIIGFILLLTCLSLTTPKVFAATTYKGVALKKPTYVYESGSTSSKALKSYPVGTILTYRAFSTDWYQGNVKINGKVITGYIHKSHVENAVDNQQVPYSGVALKAPTVVYETASTNSKALRSYPIGTVMSYRTFSKNWYQGNVKLNGKIITGYIHKTHVENAIGNQLAPYKGVALKAPTVVYETASTNSKALRSYPIGSVLSYRSFSENWYQGNVKINGKVIAGYIHKSHVENAISSNQANLKGVAVQNPTNVYARASTGAATLRSYPRGSMLYFKTFSNDWYQANVSINGKVETGYIHKDHVNIDKSITSTTSYSSNFNSVVDIQMTKAPQVSGTNGGWVNASRQQVEYYVNSSNFAGNFNSYFQFLVLSRPAGLNIQEVNQKILYNHGSLTGKAKAFSDAGNKFNLNEAYLISHALLETGNGSSKLASGVPVDKNGNVVDAKQRVHTVYNMYGIGAYDSCPLTCGAKEAFNKGWFTPEEAIIGGAAFVNEYIGRGQDTLYKMRWNPISPGYPQYATDIAWATKQTINISKIYNLLDNYVLIYDVPKYANQPSSSGNPNTYLSDPKLETSTGFPSGIYGVTNTSGTLNLRQGSDTNSKIVTSIPSGSKLEIIAEATGQVVNSTNKWYQVKFSGKTGWVLSSYVDLLNLLEVTADSINVRDGAGTSFKPVGSVKKGNLISAVLDTKNNLSKKTANGHIWYLVNFNGTKAWVSGGVNGIEYIKAN